MARSMGLYPGCVTSTEQYNYEMSIREVLPELGIELVDVENTSCCGSPFKSINLLMQTYLSARNIAIFEMQGLDMYTPCPQCHLSLVETKNRMNESSDLREKVNSLLMEEEGLKYKGNVNIYHTLNLLHDIVGLDMISEKVKRPLGMNIACHEGCQTVRYTEAGRPDRSEHPEKMERIIRTLGGTASYYSDELNCCGAPLMVTHKESAITKAGEKLKAVKDRGFEAMAIVCPFGGRVLDSKQDRASETIGEKIGLPVFYLTQLIGISMGKDPTSLGLNLNRSPVGRLLK